MAGNANPVALAGAAGARGCLARVGKTETRGQRRDRQEAVAIIRGRDGTRWVVVAGRQLWALRQLIAAGARGMTPITHPGPRWSDYIRKLRLAGIDIETRREEHGGAYPGMHGVYVLHSDVTLEPLAEAGR